MIYRSMGDSEGFRLKSVGGEDIKRFLDVLEASEFPNRGDVIERINSEPRHLEMSEGFSVPASSMREVYEIRLDIAERKNRQTPFAVDRLEELRHFVTNLEESPVDDEVALWILKVDDASSYHLFESRPHGKILGCFFGVDKRRVSAEKWQELWGIEE